MNNQGIQKKEPENENIYSKYPNNKYNTKNGSNLTQDGVDNVKETVQIFDEYVNLKLRIFIVFRSLLYTCRITYYIKTVFYYLERHQTGTPKMKSSQTQNYSKF